MGVDGVCSDCSATNMAFDGGSGGIDRGPVPVVAGAERTTFLPEVVGESGHVSGGRMSGQVVFFRKR